MCPVLIAILLTTEASGVRCYCLGRLHSALSKPPARSAPVVRRTPGEPEAPPCGRWFPLAYQEQHNSPLHVPFVPPSACGRRSLPSFCWPWPCTNHRTQTGTKAPTHPRCSTNGKARRRCATRADPECPGPAIQFPTSGGQHLPNSTAVGMTEREACREGRGLAITKRMEKGSWSSTNGSLQPWPSPSPHNRRLKNVTS